MFVRVRDVHDCSLDCSVFIFFSSIQIRIVNYVRNYFYTISINIFLTMILDSFVLLQNTIGCYDV